MRILLAAAVACTIHLGLSHAQDARAALPAQGATASSEKRNVSIPAQGLASALQSFARERALYLIFASQDVAPRRTAGASGELTQDETLKTLLSGTGLTYRYLDEKTVSIVPIATAPTTRSRISELADASTFRVAQADQGSSARTTPAERSYAADERSATLAEIVVTAQRREERLRDVPISISVLSSEELDRSTTSGLYEELTRVPGVMVSEHTIGGAQIPVRGVSAGVAIFNGSSPTAYYLDGVPFGFVRSAIGPNPNVYDLERVEVLRGPQGTLYGASALNGVVRVLTNDADLHRFELKGRASGSSTEGGADNYRGDLAVNVPLVAGKLGARVAAGYQDRSGWIDKPNRENANEAELRDGRLKINAQPTENLSVGLSAWFSRSDYGAPSLADDNARHPSPRDMPIATDYDVYGATIGYEFPSFSLASITSHLEYANRSFIDLAPQIPLPARGVVIESGLSNEAFAQELLLRSTHQGKWSWSAGGIYRDAEDRVFQNIPGIFPAPVIFAVTSESYAVFGELTRLFADGQWRLTGGLRYSRDEQGGAVSSPVQVSDVVSEFHATTPRVILAWHPSARVMVYGSYSEGFRSGLNQSIQVQTEAPFIPPADPDRLRNYEIGAKSTALSGRVDFETAVYFMDWRDVQQDARIRIITPTGFPLDIGVIINGESASGLGVDLAVKTRPLERLELGANVSWNDLAVDADVFSGGLLVFGKGDRLSFSAETTAGAWVDYGFPIGRGGLEGELSFSGQYTSAETHRTVTGPRVEVTPSDSVLTSRASFSISAPRRWSASLFVDNLNNADASPFKGLSGFPWFDRRVTPRVIGMQVQFELGARP